MPELKTKKTAASVTKFLAAIPDKTRRADAKVICKLMAKATTSKPAMWGPGIVGFGHRKLVYPNGRTLDWMAAGFAPRKAAMVVYLPEGPRPHADLLARLGKHKASKGCLYLKRLTDIDLAVLEKLVRTALASAG